MNNFKLACTSIGRVGTEIYLKYLRGRLVTLGGKTLTALILQLFIHCFSCQIVVVLFQILIKTF